MFISMAVSNRTQSHKRPRTLAAVLNCGTRHLSSQSMQEAAQPSQPWFRHHQCFMTHQIHDSEEGPVAKGLIVRRIKFSSQETQQDWANAVV